MRSTAFCCIILCTYCFAYFVITRCTHTAIYGKLRLAVSTPGTVPRIVPRTFRARSTPRHKHTPTSAPWTDRQCTVSARLRIQNSAEPCFDTVNRTGRPDRIAMTMFLSLLGESLFVLLLTWHTILTARAMYDRPCHSTMHRLATLHRKCISCERMINTCREQPPPATTGSDTAVKMDESS